MTQLELTCVIVGEGPAFDVEIDAGQAVGELKDAIKRENKVTIQCDAKNLQLFLAKQDDAWLDGAGAASATLDKHGTLQGFADQMDPKLWINNDKHFGKNFRPGEGEVHVLVVVLHPPSAIHTTVLHEPEQFAKECTSLEEWRVGGVHEIRYIFRFMRTLGRCTVDGKIFWRSEEKQVVKVLMDGWFRESTANNINVHAKKKSILIGSPGIGKSTLLCVVAFCLVLKYQKNVLVYRKLPQENCLFYLGYEDGNVVQVTVEMCKFQTAVDIYDELIRQKKIANVWLLLDGFHYHDIPEGLETFKLLVTSQPVYLKSQERVYAYCCLLPCWSKNDLWSLGNLIHKFGDDEVDERYYYSGGSVREFTLDTSEEIRKAIDDDVSGMEELSIVSRTFIGDAGPVTREQLTARRYWEQVIESEYAVRALSLRLRSDALYRIYNWALRNDHKSLAESAFEFYFHKLAADNMLKLYVSEYDPPTFRKPDEPRHQDVKSLRLRNGGAVCCGMAGNYESDLTKWRDSEDLTYWYPACDNFPNIDSIVKIESVTGKKSVAYLQITVAREHGISEQEPKNMNQIVFPADAEKSEDVQPPIFVAVCPDRESCSNFVLKSSPEVEAVRKLFPSRVFAGYCEEDRFAVAAGGPKSNVPVKDLRPPSPYDTRKHARNQRKLRPGSFDASS